MQVLVFSLAVLFGLTLLQVQPAVAMTESNHGGKCNSTNFEDPVTNQRMQGEGDCELTKNLICDDGMCICPPGYEWDSTWNETIKDHGVCVPEPTKPARIRRKNRTARTSSTSTSRPSTPRPTSMASFFVEDTITTPFFSGADGRPMTLTFFLAFFAIFGLLY